MEMTLVGPWVVLGVGAVAVLGAVWLTVTRPQERRPLTMWVFGVLLLGVGAYGPAFLSDYASVLKIILRMDEEPGRASYQAFLDRMAEGDVPERLQDVGTAVMLQHPLPDLETMLAQAAGRTQEPEVKARLESAQESLKADRVQAQVATEQFLEGKLDRATLFSLPEGTRFHVARELEQAPESERTRHRIRPEDLDALRRAPGDLRR